MRQSLKILTALAFLGSFCATVATVSAQTALPAPTPDDRWLGKADAPITVIEYASANCVHCAAFTNEKLPLVKSDWIETGKARWIFRDFPLDNISLRAATLGRCLPADRFFNFIEAVFKERPNWTAFKDDERATQYIAGLGGYTKQQADACLKDTKFTNFVADERLTGEKTYGINMTPYFFISGERVPGNPPYPDLQRVLQAALTKP